MIGYNASNEEPQRPDRLEVSDAQIAELTESHLAFKSHLEDARYSLPFVAGSRGIATTAGGVYLPVAVVSIQMLRETGCTLPVEVFLASDDEWDSQICDVLFPRMSARCVVLDSIFSSGTSGKGSTVGIDKYQFKVMAVVFSSFEEVLFLDSDCFPTTDPTDLFSWGPFKQTGMVRWPDFWFPSESPHFFDIAGIATPRIQDRGSTESGELMYHKPRHTDSLLLALYYNFHGPNYYYPLQAQGNAGEGDKETFLWSQVVFGDAFYSVQQMIRAMGYLTLSGEWRGSAMAQFDPRNDATYTMLGPAAYDDRGLSVFPPMFLHVNFPKINPASIFQDVSFGCKGPTKDSDGSMRRLWTENEEQAVGYFGFDVERRLWRVVRDVACEFEGTFSAWEGQTDVCANATAYWDAVYGHTELE